MRSASRSPAAYETPGITPESAYATPSNVLWLSLRTMTFHGRPSPAPSPRSTRSRGGVSVLMSRSYVAVRDGSYAAVRHPPTHAHRDRVLRPLLPRLGAD